ncbi:hypothetical protein J8J14_14430 [Roseomonas sp. SSH11]|uniref:Nitrogen fixation protein FixH n=1 Tax=Pararoseomonas baculiformis TaxID=2820812 RepID=A0ABS4AG36_9PROT|nr:hypothetical protein [Pararoseomonas baculiformis]
MDEASRIVGEDLAFQRKVWRFQRLGWFGMAVLILLAMAGAFGGGPLSYASARSDDGALEVAWERIERLGRSSELRIRIRQLAPGPLELRLEEGLVEDVEVAGGQPRPVSETRAPGRIGMRFEPPPGEQWAEILLNLRATRPGLVSGTLAAGASRVRVRIVVLP